MTSKQPPEISGLNPVTGHRNVAESDRNQVSASRPTGVSLIKPYFFENRYTLALGMLSLITVDLLQLFIPRIIKWTVDDLTAFGIGHRQLLKYALYMLAIAILIGFFRYIWRRCLLGTSRRLEEGLRNRLFSHLQTLSAAYFDRAKSGDLMAHATNDIQQVRMATGMGLVALNDAVVLGIAAIGFMAYISVQLTALVLIPMPLIVFGTKFFSKKMHRRYQVVQAAFSDLTEVSRERFAGIRIIKAHNRQKKETARVEAVSQAYIQKNIRLVKIEGAFFPMMLLFTNLSLAIVLYFGGRQTILMTITAGDFVAFISYLGLLTWPMMALGWVTNLIQRGRASLDRIGHILETVPAIKEDEDARPVDRMRGHIAFENVYFNYDSDEGSHTMATLAAIDLSIAPGQVLGIVGPPGSGKSTLLSLIPRLYDVRQGRILLDGFDVRTLKIQDLRSQISCLPQEPFLFDGTIRANITFGNHQVTDQQLAVAVNAAALDDMVRHFPNGLDTVVGERGVILSGGQKQRITLARCLLQDTPILLLDDPVSQVDLETGMAIVDTIRSAVGRKTVIIVSHRLSALSHADRIIALDQGRITESGTHAALMQAEGYYAKTFRLQQIEEEFNAS